MTPSTERFQTRSAVAGGGRRPGVLLATPGRRFGPAALLAAWLLAGGCAGTRSGFEVPPGAGDALTPARAALASGNEAGAILKLEDFLRENPGSGLVDEANYLLGRAHLLQKTRVLAADHFQRVLQDYPQSRFSPEASYYLAEAYDGLARPSQLDQDWTGKAIGAYRGFITRYPDRPEAARARERILALEDRLARKDYENGILYLKMRAPEAARLYFQLVLDEHPESTWACRASLGLGEALLRLRRWDEAATQLQRVEDACTGEVQARATGFLALARQMAADSGAGVPDTSAAADSASAP